VLVAGSGTAAEVLLKVTRTSNCLCHCSRPCRLRIC
jgi:hypothetical protein